MTTGRDTVGMLGRIMAVVGLMAVAVFGPALPVVGGPGSNDTARVGSVVPSPLAAQTVAAQTVAAQLAVALQQDGADPASPPAPLWGPFVVDAEAPPPLRLRDVVVEPGGPGGEDRVVVGFAEGFDAPEGRWQVVVGAGDPAGEWLRAEVLWDGAAAAASLQTVVGPEAEPIGEPATDITGSVGLDTVNGQVAVGLPADTLDGIGGDVLWVAAELGEDPDAVERVQGPWFMRSELAGLMAPGTVPGGRYGFPVGGSSAGGEGDPEVDSPPSVPAGVPTVVGEPSVAEVVTGSLEITPGVAPTELDGQAVSAVVDVVTIAPGEGTSGPQPQVRLDLTAGTVELGSGTFTGPAWDGLADSVGEPASPAWLVAGLPGPVEGPVNPVVVDIAGVFDAAGVTIPGAIDVGAGAVSVRRMVVLDDGTEIDAVGVVAGGGWLAQGAVATTAPPAFPVDEAAAADEGSPSSDVVTMVALGIAAGLVLVVASVLAASALARRRLRAGDEWDDHTDALGSVVVGPSWTDDLADVGPEVEPEVGPEVGPEVEAGVQWDGVAEESVGDGPDSGMVEVDGDEPDPPAPPDEASTVGQSVTEAPALASLDEEMDALAERLRRLRGPEQQD